MLYLWHDMSEFLLISLEPTEWNPLVVDMVPSVLSVLACVQNTI